MTPNIPRHGPLPPVTPPTTAGPAENLTAPAPRAERPDDLPPVYQFPVVGTVQATFVEAGRHDPLPFPDQDD